MDYIVKSLIFRYFLLCGCVLLVSGQFRLVNDLLSSKSDESNITYVKINPVGVTTQSILTVADDESTETTVDVGVGRGFQQTQGHIDKTDELIVNRSNELNAKLEQVKDVEEKEANLIRINIEKSATTESSSSSRSSSTTLSGRIGKLQESALDINKEFSAFNVIPTTSGKPLDDQQFHSSKPLNSRITRIRPHGFTTASTTASTPTTISAFKQHQQHQQQQQRIKDSSPIITNKILIENPIYYKKPINKNRHFKSKCHCEKIQNCPKIQISISRCPPDYFMCCF